MVREQQFSRVKKTNLAQNVHFYLRFPTSSNPSPFQAPQANEYVHASQKIAMKFNDVPRFAEKRVFNKAGIGIGTGSGGMEPKIVAGCGI